MMPRLEIRQAMGMLEINTTHARLIPSKTEVTFTADSRPAVMTGSNTFAKVKIDQTETFASEGLKSPLRLTDEAANRAMRDNINTIARIASEGETFMRAAQNHGEDDPVSRLAWRHMLKDAPMRVGMRSVPSVAPKISVQKGESHAEVRQTKPDIQWNRTVDQGMFEPSRVDVSWRQRPGIEIRVVPGKPFRFTGIGSRVNVAA